MMIEKEVKKVCRSCGAKHGTVPTVPIWVNQGVCDICKRETSVGKARAYGL